MSASTDPAMWFDEGEPDPADLSPPGPSRVPMIAPVHLETDREVLGALLEEFHAWMAAHAPGVYDPAAELQEDFESLAAEPESWAWIGHVDEEPAGCVLLYGETDRLAEFRRLWVRPAARGRGLGRDLTETVVDRARREGYEVLGLTTPPWAEQSHALYESLGFERTAPYPETRLDEAHHDDAIFMVLSLVGDVESA